MTSLCSGVTRLKTAVRPIAASSRAPARRSDRARRASGAATEQSQIPAHALGGQALITGQHDVRSPGSRSRLMVSFTPGRRVGKAQESTNVRSRSSESEMPSTSPDATASTRSPRGGKAVVDREQLFSSGADRARARLHW